MVSDDFNRVFVSADSTVAAKAPEFAGNCSFGCCARGRFFLADVPVTSSTIPIVKPFFGSSFARFSYTAKMLDGGVSLLPRP